MPPLLWWQFVVFFDQLALIFVTEQGGYGIFVFMGYVPDTPGCRKTELPRRFPPV